ncbi:hypothetical protein D3C71_471660 [compost metagenome]
MFKYAKAQTDVLLSLINESNPGLVEARDLANSLIGVPAARTPGAGEIQDTSVSIFATPASFYVGKRAVTYRRIDLAKLFANTVVELDIWLPGTMSPAIFVQEVNKKYGLALLESDISATNRVSQAGVQNMIINATSLLYKGTFVFRWLMGKRTINEIMGSVRPPGLRWDVNHVEGKPIATLVGFGVDYTGQLATINQLATTVNLTSTQNPFVKTLITKLNSYTGLNLDILKDHTQVGGLLGLAITKITIPSDNAIEANSAKFNRVLVISALPGSWFCGKFLFHYNA